MSSTDLNNFIKALDILKRDYTCGVCSELCKNPITLSKCFHLICSDHFEGLKKCPECNISLEGCTSYVDDRLGPCIESAKVLDTMFSKYKETLTKTESSSSHAAGAKRGKQKGNDKTSEVIKPDFPPKDGRKKRTKQTEQSDIETDSKENKPKSNQRKSEKKSKTENINLSVLSTNSKLKATEKRNNKGETALHVACRLGKIDKVTELLIQGANTNIKDNAGWTPLHEVVQNGHLDLVKLLLQYNTLINVPGQSNETPLHEAVRFNHGDIAEELVRNGADLHARNCKGDTPIQLAKGEMKKILEKAAENIIQTQSINVVLMSELHTELDLDDIRVYCVSQYRSVMNKLKTLVKYHSNLTIEAKWSKKVTHLIVDAEDDGVCESSLDILQGIVSCVWIISSKWVTNSTEEKLDNFTDYEVTGVGTTTYKGPNNARYNKYKQYPGIFNGCHFYLHNFSTKYEISKTIVITKAILSKLITDAGGIVLRRAPNPESIPESEKLVPYHARKGGKLVNCAHYIIFKDIYEPMYNMQHLKALPIGWLIECIEKYELCEPW